MNTESSQSRNVSQALRGESRLVAVPAHLPEGIRMHVEVTVQGPAPSAADLDAGVRLLREVTVSDAPCMTFERSERGDVTIRASL